MKKPINYEFVFGGFKQLDKDEDRKPISANYLDRIRKKHPMKPGKLCKEVFPEDYKFSEEYQRDLKIEAQFKSDNTGDIHELVREGYEHDLRILRHQVPCYSEKRFEEARDSVLKAQSLLSIPNSYYSEVFYCTYQPAVVQMAKTAQFIKTSITSQLDDNKQDTQEEDVLGK